MLFSRKPCGNRHSTETKNARVTGKLDVKGGKSMKEITSKSREIAKAIVFAQLASDGGKKIYDLIDEVNCKGAHRCFKMGYSTKDANILKAIDLINKTRSEEVRYSVIATEDQNGYDSSLIYFTFRLNGKRHQVSFHSPGMNKYTAYRHYVKKSCTTHWDARVQSRWECLELAERFGWA